MAAADGQILEKHGGVVVKVMDTLSNVSNTSAGLGSDALAFTTTRPEAYYLMYDMDPPGWLRALWIAAAVCTGCTYFIGYRQVKKHIQAATDSGYGGNPFTLLSYGPRGNRMLHLLMMPPILCTSAVVQMLLPAAEPLCSLLRIIQVSIAVLKLSELMFILAGGWTRVKSKLPSGPVKPYSQPPLCCFQCTKQVTEDDVRILSFGMKQFSVTAPVLGTLDAFFAASDPKGAELAVKFLLGFYSLTTMIGMASFNNLYALLSHGVASQTKSLRNRQMYVTLQMVSVKVVELILRNAITGHYDMISAQDLAAIIGGFVVCVTQLLLALLGTHAFPASRRMYPKRSFESDFPPDTLATLQLVGIREGTYQVLRDMEQEAATDPKLSAQELDEISDDEDSTSADESDVGLAGLWRGGW